MDGRVAPEGTFRITTGRHLGGVEPRRHRTQFEAGGLFDVSRFLGASCKAEPPCDRTGDANSPIEVRRRVDHRGEPLTVPGTGYCCIPPGKLYGTLDAALTHGVRTRDGRTRWVNTAFGLVGSVPGDELFAVLQRLRPDLTIEVVS
ncbi:MAG TPA: hypothetical protein VKE74_30240 [Gemmataceae bacterium]|nr:hypothetical protein [Gemmataceae bacterium]